MDYKDTLLMPNTAFEMRGNLPKKEPAILASWQASKHYERLLAARKDQALYVLHDGPPYANGNLHAGTAMNRVLKDFVIRSKAMSGYLTPFIPGWDTHGLPIENAVIKQGVDRKKVTPQDFRAACHNYALKQIEIQKATMERLGAIADYQHPYITLTKDFEADQVQAFAKMALAGLIYQGLKPVYWSYASESALAESEIVYHDKKDPAIFVAFQVSDGKGILTEADYFVIWTTTPWTIPANLAVALHPDFTYAKVKTAKGNLIVLADKVAELMEKFDLNDYEVLATYRGKDLELITVKHPFYPDRPSLVILGDHVTAEDGTGCVHTAPGHGLEDFYVAQKYGLPAFCPVDEKGLMTAEAGEFLAGQFVDEANKTITLKLEELGNLLSLEFITHSYPYDDRMKAPVIYRATVQWFASIDKIREQLLSEISKVRWENEWGEARLYSMIKERGDWCISRQRLWGLPIPIIYAEDDTPLMDKKVFEHLADLFRTHGSNIWFELSAEELLPVGFKHPASPNGRFRKETDIMDVWFDSGSSHQILNARGLPYPADLYFEGSDQYRGWFNSSLIVGLATRQQAPYKSVISHGYVLDNKGNKMSKSIGNIVDPIAVIDVYGADTFRLWCATIDFKQDVRIGDDILKQISEHYRKIRNTFRFMLGNLNPADFDPQKDLLSLNELTLVDQHLLALFADIQAKASQAYERFDFLTVSNSLMVFMSRELSAYYLDFTKDILYIEKQTANRRRQVQTVLWLLTDALVRLWAPILVYTAEEIYGFFNPSGVTVHTLEFASNLEIKNSEQLKQDFKRLFALREVVFKQLEEARNEKVIGKPLEAAASIKVNQADYVLVEKYLKEDLAQWLTISQVNLVSNESADLAVTIDKAVGTTCPRCWNITAEPDEAGLCPRCQAVLGE